jgi:hypothetical protein
MEEASRAGSGEARPTLSESWDAWEEYYRQASLRRRSQHGRSSLREAKRRRRLRERVGIAISTLVVGGLTLFFYLVLTRP